MSIQSLADSPLETADPAVAELIQAEIARQSETICLIPSENYVSRAVLEAMGSVFTNKYSEGYAGRRYYEGQQIVDRLEPLAIDRAGERLTNGTKPGRSGALAQWGRPVQHTTTMKG